MFTGQVLSPTLPEGTEVVFNSLYNTFDIKYLDEDMFYCRLPNKFIIDVGYYYHSHFQNGSIVIRVHKDDKNHWFGAIEKICLPLKEPPIEKDLSELSYIISSLASKWIRAKDTRNEEKRID